MEVGLEVPSKRVFSVGDHDEACTGCTIPIPSKAERTGLVPSPLETIGSSPTRSETTRVAGKAFGRAVFLASPPRVVQFSVQFYVNLYLGDSGSRPENAPIPGTG